MRFSSERFTILQVAIGAVLVSAASACGGIAEVDGGGSVRRSAAAPGQGAAVDFTGHAEVVRTLLKHVVQWQGCSGRAAIEFLSMDADEWIEDLRWCDEVDGVEYCEENADWCRDNDVRDPHWVCRDAEWTDITWRQVWNQIGVGNSSQLEPAWELPSHELSKVSWRTELHRTDRHLWGLRTRIQEEVDRLKILVPDSLAKKDIPAKNVYLKKTAEDRLHFKLWWGETDDVDNLHGVVGKLELNQEGAFDLARYHLGPLVFNRIIRPSSLGVEVRNESWILGDSRTEYEVTLE